MFDCGKISRFTLKCSASVMVCPTSYLIFKKSVHYLRIRLHTHTYRRLQLPGPFKRTWGHRCAQWPLYPCPPLPFNTAQRSSTTQLWSLHTPSAAPCWHVQSLHRSQSEWPLMGRDGTMDKTEAVSISSRGNDPLPVLPCQEAQDALRGPLRVSRQAKSVLVSRQ